MRGLLSISRPVLSHLKSNLLSKTTSKDYNFKARCFSTSKSSNMKLLQFSYKDSPEEIRAGYLEECGCVVVDLNKSSALFPVTLLEILREGCLDAIGSICNPVKVPLADVILRAPIHNMDKVLCIGLNYHDHCSEQDLKPPAVPMVFSKFASTISGPGDTVKLRTTVTQKVDWEVELALVIGKKASFVSSADAYRYVAGYTAAQDLSARDWQKDKNSGQFLLGKSMDSFCPIGPYIVTHDEIGDPQQLDICCKLNGVVKQTSNTCQLIYKIPDLIERISSVMTLLPGDIMLTGTPGGVGMYRTPPEWLRPGDVLTNTVEKIGTFDIKFGKY